MVSPYLPKGGAMPQTWAQWAILGAAAVCGAAVAAFLLAHLVTSERAWARRWGRTRTSDPDREAGAEAMNPRGGNVAIVLIVLILIVGTVLAFLYGLYFGSEGA
jgi:hypothetical protein